MENPLGFSNLKAAFSFSMKAEKNLLIFRQEKSENLT
jgi:hypothetical protein